MCAGDFAGCTATYTAMKFILFHSMPRRTVDNFLMEYDDYDGREYVLNKLKSFPIEKIQTNELSLCLLELAFNGFKNTFPTNEHMMVIVRCKDKFRIVQSFEGNFSFTEELNARDWINAKEMEILIECLITVLFGNDQEKAMNGFKKLYRYPLKTDRKRFRDRTCKGALGIYIANNIAAKTFIQCGNKFVSDILKQM